MAVTAIRRHHRNRMVQKYYRQHWEKTSDARIIGFKEWRERSARKAIKTRCVCSCYLCISSRRKYGNGKAARTWQELAAIRTLKEEL